MVCLLKMKNKIWSTAVADKKFSEWIRKRDKKCVLCGGTNHLTNSHYWGRYASSTRYDPEDCDAVCLGCHFKIENAKQGEYRTFKLEQLGKKRYDALEKRYYQEKIPRRCAIIRCMSLLKHPVDN